MTEIVDRLGELFARHGAEQYHGEAVTQAQHGLQAAALAVQEGAPPTLVAAALLHDVGHLLASEGEDAARRGIDTRHEEEGADWLAAWFPAAVTDPIRLHVPAKRFLCGADPAYLGGLSEASVLSLSLQGGPMTMPERLAFLAMPHAAEAVRLRRWDDLAKRTDWEVPGFDAYRPALRTVLDGR